VYYILEFMRFLKHYGFTTKCSNIFKVWWDIQSHCVANFVLSLAVKNFWKSINISQGNRHE